MKCHLLLYPLALALTAALAKDEFLPIEQAFTYLAQGDAGHLTIQWNVAPGYYLYKSRMGMESATPGITLGPPQYPKGEVHKDEFFGPQEVFRDDFKVSAPITRTAQAPDRLTVKLKLQGCADAGLCYPPTVWQTQVPLPRERKATK